MITLSVNKNEVGEAFRAYVWQVQNRYLKQAMNSAAVVLETEYRNTLRQVARVPGNKSFIPAWEAVANKVRMFKDSNGVWAIIGIKAGSDGKSLAPQAWMGEHGTVKRETEAGENRGIMPAQHYLAQVAAKAMPMAVDAFWTKLRSLVNAN